MTTQPTQPEKNDTQVTVVEDSSAPDSSSQATDASSIARSSEADAIHRVPTIASPHVEVEGPGRPQGSPLLEEPAPPSFTALIEEFRQREERMAEADAAAAPEGGPPERQGAGAREGETPLEGRRLGASEIQEADSARADGQGGVVDVTSRVPTDGRDEKVDSAEPGSAPKPHRLVPPPLRPAGRGRMPRQGSGRGRETFVQKAKGERAGAQGGNAIQSSGSPEEVSATPLAAAPVVDTERQTAGRQEDEQTSLLQEEPPMRVPTPETAVQEAQTEQAAPPKPARRYRFDRREPTVQPAHAILPVKPVSPPPFPPAPAESVGVGRAQGEGEGASVGAPESDVTAPTAPASSSQHDRRRRHGQESRQAGAVPGQPSSEALKDAVKAETTRQADVVKQADATARVPTGAQTASPVEQQVMDIGAGTTEQASTEIAVEDLPPLEYAELQAASRRRRRRRAGSGTGAATSVPVPANKPVTQVASGPAPAPGAPAAPVTPPPAPTRTPNGAQAPYAIQSGMTVNQMNQGNDVSGPFQGPEPTPARGSVLPVQPRLTRSMRNGSEAQRGTVTGLPAGRSGGGADGMLSTGAVNHLANVISQAIQTQSDRLAAELRRTNQAGASVSVTVPPFPSTERVGVFVDVANLLYSARTLRTTIDFGKLLDFLRGNRRLVRAHAYTPTSPQPGDDQMFLQAVKGLGYRITTKNYKTFASGAKKADMDLDLCMDVVRLVDARAVDTIVLVSGDSDFIPLLDYCSDHGVRVEVVAFDESMSASLRQSCDLFINLSMLDEIRVS